MTCSHRSLSIISAGNGKWKNEWACDDCDERLILISKPDIKQECCPYTRCRGCEVADERRMAECKCPCHSKQKITKAFECIRYYPPMTDKQECKCLSGWPHKIEDGKPLLSNPCCPCSCHKTEEVECECGFMSDSWGDFLTHIWKCRTGSPKECEHAWYSDDTWEQTDMERCMNCKLFRKKEVEFVTKEEEKQFRLLLTDGILWIAEALKTIDKNKAKIVENRMNDLRKRL